MFQFGRFALIVTGLQPAGFPHSEITGSILICRSPMLIAAYHVLHRLREPRHPPCTLCYFLPLMRLLRRIVCFFALVMMSHTFQIAPSGEHKHNSRLLLFALLFNFFQYVKELSFKPKVQSVRLKAAVGHL